MNIKLVEYIAQYVKTECSGYYKISKYPICQQQEKNAGPVMNLTSFTVKVAASLYS